MLLENKNAVIYGGGGAVGGAVAREFARAGARVFVTGRSAGPVDKVAAAIRADGGHAEAAQLDALDEPAVEKHLAALVEKAGRVDVSFNAIGISGAQVVDKGLQGLPLVQQPLDSFMLPIDTYVRAHFVTARAAARRMVAERGGVILMHTPEPARLGVPLVGGMAVAWAAMEALNRGLSAELAAQGVRAVCLRSTGMPETRTIDFVFGVHAKALGITREQFQALMEGMSHTRRSSTLAEVADTAVFLASDLARGMTGTVANLTGGKIAD
jgi:NAD(P)-dependent dehydrogenase (short-subunit alcohol dehydrogenase family)